MNEDYQRATLRSYGWTDDEIDTMITDRREAGAAADRLHGLDVPPDTRADLMNRDVPEGRRGLNTVTGAFPGAHFYGLDVGTGQNTTISGRMQRDQDRVEPTPPHPGTLITDPIGDAVIEQEWNEIAQRAREGANRGRDWPPRGDEMRELLERNPHATNGMAQPYNEANRNDGVYQAHVMGDWVETYRPPDQIRISSHISCACDGELPEIIRGAVSRNAPITCTMRGLYIQDFNIVYPDNARATDMMMSGVMRSIEFSAEGRLLGIIEQGHRTILDTDPTLKNDYLVKCRKALLDAGLINGLTLDNEVKNIISAAIGSGKPKEGKNEQR